MSPRRLITGEILELADREHHEAWAIFLIMIFKVKHSVHLGIKQTPSLNHSSYSTMGRSAAHTAAFKPFQREEQKTHSWFEKAKLTPYLSL